MMNKTAKVKLKKQIGVVLIVGIMLAIAFVMAAEGDYLSIEWNTAGTTNLRGIESNDTYIWAAEISGDTINKYSARDGTYISNFSVVTNANNPYGVTTNGTWIWVMDRIGDEVVKYNMSGTYISSWSLTGANGDANDIATNGSQFWICDVADDEVYTYNMSGYQTGNWDIGAQGNDDCVGITHDGAGSIWTMDEVTEDIYRWNANDGAYISQYDTGVDTASSYGITANETWIYVSAITSQSFFIYEGSDGIFPLTVTACTNLTISGGNYTLANDISSTQPNCIIFMGSNIELDGRGYNITGDYVNSDSAIVGSSSFNNKDMTIANMTISGFASFAVVLSNINNSFFSNLNVSDNQAGFTLSGGINNTIDNVIVANISQSGAGAFTSQLNLTIRDSYFNTTRLPADNDIALTKSYNVILLNTTADTIGLNGGIYFKKWYFQPQVNYTHNGTAAVGVNISAVNISSSVLESELTGTIGNTTRWELTEYQNLNDTITYYNNYTISASLTNWITDNDSFNITNNVYFQQFLLAETTAPAISITYPTNGITTEDYLIDINYTISDAIGLSACWYNNETGALNISLACGDNVTALSWNEGQHNVTIWGNDTSNNIGNDMITFILKRLNVTLSDPAHDDTIVISGANFTANYTTTIDSNFTNVTYFIWYSNTTLYNETTRTINGTVNSTTLNIEGLETGTYYWNTLACAESAAEHYCHIADSNFTLLVGLISGNDTFGASVYETSSQVYTTNFTLAADSSLISANLVYNYTFYTVSNISIDGTDYLLTREIDVPLNDNYFVNQTNAFFWSFVFVNDVGTQSYQNTSLSHQNVTYLAMSLCNATFPTSNSHALNFTMYDELTTNPIAFASNHTTIKTTFNYWIGSGTVKKAYSYENMTNPIAGEYNFCIFPHNETLSADMDMEYSALDYSPRKYFLNAAPLDNETNDIRLELLTDADSVKFFIEVREGAISFPDATITISKYFTGEGVYRTTEIRETDTNGEFIAYLDLDQTYQFLIVKNGTSYGTVTEQAICTESPCEMVLQIEEASVDMWQGYYDVFATDVSYTLLYNETTQMVTYTFSDLTGLAQYFALDVYETKYDVNSELVIEPDGTYCNKTLASVTGTLTCNMTNYTSGDFTATGYISRSPPLVIELIYITISSLKDTLGLLGIFISFVIIVVVGLAGIWNPAVGVALTAVAILLMKIIGFMAFSYTTVILIVILGGILIFKMKS